MRVIPSEQTMEEENTRVTEAIRVRTHLRITSVWDLVNTSIPYPEAIPVLIEWLPQVSHPRVKEGIVRALTVKEARGVASKILVDEFKRLEAPLREPRFDDIPRDQHGVWLREPTPEERYSAQLWHLKWAVGNALGYLADESVISEVTDLIRDKRHGGTRSQLVWALVRLRPAGTEELILELLDDEDDGVAIQAALAAGAIGLQAARTKIEQRFLRHRDSWMRRQAKRILTKLDRTQ